MRSLILVAVLGLASMTSAQDPEVPVGALGGRVDATLIDRRWQPRRLAELGARTATVLFFTASDCPLVMRYLPRIGRLAEDYAARGVVVVAVDVGAGDRLVDAAGEIVLAAPASRFGKDFDGALARACGVDRTATAVVLDAERRIVYRGRVDDQYGYAGARPAPSRHDLQAAIDQLLAGAAITIAATEVSGCRITWPAAGREAAPPTYARDIAPIVQRHCAECHRPGGTAPFSLLEPRDAIRRAAMIGEVTAQGRMPPWYGSARHGAFGNHRGMTADERERIAAWVAGGARAGDAADLPAPRQWPEQEWRIGEPDQIIAIKAPIRLPADGIVAYKYLFLPFRFEHDTWVEAIEILPSNKRALHHCNLVRGNLGEKWSQRGFITGYVPGGDAMVLDQGTAVRIPKGSALVLQAHYVTTGQPEIDRLRVGLRFPRVPVQKELQVTIAGNRRFRIPPGAAAHPVRSQRTLPHDADGIGLFVHMHLRGRDIAVFADAPDGTRENLLVVPNYNFDWQQSYRWPTAGKPFAKGTVISALAHFDNSAWNPFNPDPGAEVAFGLQTADEMMYAFLFWTRRDQALGLRVDPKTGRVVAGAGEDR